MAPCYLSFLFISTFVLAINAQSDVQPIRDCGPNAIWSACKLPCSPSCDTINDPNPVRCYSLLCRPGCNCIEGYVRKSRNSPECVLKEECPKETTPQPGGDRRCGPFAVWRNCVPWCPNNCDGLSSVSCISGCVNRCDCIKGYIRRSLTDPTCIPEEDCPNRENPIDN